MSTGHELCRHCNPPGPRWLRALGRLVVVIVLAAGSLVLGAALSAVFA